ncbi:hypothetical protein B566_EDAN010381 [Ephemera danica]|nr:hypothetical protein B566_EDAN010381 [Ephemera danica]
MTYWKFYLTFGPMLEAERLKAALQGGAKSPDFTELVAWISQELKSFCKLDEHVSATSSPEDSSHFLMELGSFLKELNCPYEELVVGHVSDRLQSYKSRVTLLLFLLSELQAGRMVYAAKPDPSQALTVKLHESSTASDLKTLLMALRFPKPPDNITPAMLFGKVDTKVKEAVARASPELVGKPLFSGVLSDKQWQTLNNLQEDLQQEYLMRRQMLLKRLDVTVQSFQWSDRAKSCQDQIVQTFRTRRASLIETPTVHLADLLAAREDLAILEKTSGSAVRKNTQSDVNRVLIGRVPDRGGRPEDQRAPPPEMPSWQPRKPDAPGGGGGGWRGGRGEQRGGDRGRGGGGGGWGSKNESRVQGGWNRGGAQIDTAYQGDGGQGGGGGYYQQGGGGPGYQGGRGRGNRGRGGRGRGRDQY